jgi:hypothetical protein
MSPYLALKIEFAKFCAMVMAEKDRQMKPVKNLRVICLASALIALPFMASAQTTPEPLPVLALTEEPSIVPQSAGIENQSAVIVDAPVPPARPTFESQRKRVRTAVAPRAVAVRHVAATVRPRTIDQNRVVLARIFWLTVGNGF